MFAVILIGAFSICSAMPNMDAVREILFENRYFFFKVRCARKWWYWVRLDVQTRCISLRYDWQCKNDWKQWTWTPNFWWFIIEIFENSRFLKQKRIFVGWILLWCLNKIVFGDLFINLSSLRGFNQGSIGPTNQFLRNPGPGRTRIFKNFGPDQDQSNLENLGLNRTRTTKI